MIKLSNIVSRIKSFLKGVYLELKKVNWLNRQELLRYTLIVILVTFIVAAFLGGLDYIFMNLIQKFILYRAS
ncbi:preprotein translocase subunit SecE [Patescibacteria group bacterium]|nr:preprotein translocase subunit SecE [Patescibacteria group bacterium]MBU4367725.1 preprotein translocase subunit SecE [Patescibacteria group bacterium]MBU4461825.1 preprotein translocase subunit SecE [Patescibacteria group bacterium]MCG2700044.1 preprotein translocase subunit SecE [Candidatus Parcubacteria bacterium]